MKELKMSKSGRPWFYPCWLPGLALMVLLVTGCPHNEYTVELKPQGNRIERTLVFYRADGADTNTGLPNYQSFDTNELAAIAAWYPAALTDEGERHLARGMFTDKLPDDVGGAGAYLHLTTSLGETGFYSERFRGNDNLVGLLQRRFEAADRLTDLFVGWSQAELGQEPGYGPLRQFLDENFRHDLKNLAAYLWLVVAGPTPPRNFSSGSANTRWNADTSPVPKSRRSSRDYPKMITRHCTHWCKSWSRGKWACPKPGRCRRRWRFWPMTQA